MRKKIWHKPTRTKREVIGDVVCAVAIVAYISVFAVLGARAIGPMEVKTQPAVEVVQQSSSATVETANAEIDYTYTPEEMAVYKSLGEFTVTGYCPCEICCGEWAKNRPEGVVYTASEAVAQAGVTCGSDWDVLPAGTVVHIEGIGERTVQDNGSARGNIIDVYCDTHAQAVQVGKSLREVKTIE